VIYVVGGDIGSGKTLYALFMMERAAAAGRPIYTNIQLTKACPYFGQVALIDTPEFPVAPDPDGEAPACWNCGAPDKRPRGAKIGAWEDPLGGEGRVKLESAGQGYRFFWEYIVRGALVVVDEADLYFDCSDHGAMPREVRRFHKLSRKIECDVVYIVQNFENMYVRIRRLATRHIVCEYTWRSMRVFRYLEMLVGMEAARRLGRFVRSEFSDQALRDHRGDGYFTFAESQQYFGWYDTKQLLGDQTFMRVVTRETAMAETAAIPITFGEVARAVGTPGELEEAWSVLKHSPLSVAR
jgi:hypothetical protein